MFNDNDSILYLSRIQILYICKAKRHICSVFKEAPRNFLVPAIDQKVGVSVININLNVVELLLETKNHTSI